ncbi:hypothetical protein NBO_15g0002 [Nosema bombycis CQ1]|uniref:Uncharacterized protein n=1 Tax=Nosema bombycis (strain CQ1 / CVCC 102059) TaxID=578461 RepID=R0M9Z5_NOSB1|nr:hypothetical protein NBO_15g0002 [Nosema bombycis CQ1]|eukprot:EOB14789.1 hypothetical protein NBO_15g0002 [Nosema bombycis CQ1]
MVRDDLTYSLIELIERIDVIYDDLYSWYPGIKYSDPWSYFVELIPDIVQEYKNYYIRALLARDKPKDKILEVLKTRMCKGLGDFDVINRDMFMFNLDQDESEVKRLKKPGKVIKNIISKTYWNEEDSFNISQHTFNIIGAPHEKIKYSEDINLELNLGLSMIEIEVNACRV